MDVESKPMSLGEIFSVGFNTFFKNFKDLAIIGLFFMIPYGVIMGFLTPVATLGGTAELNSMLQLLQSVVQIIFAFVYIVATVAIIHMTQKRINDEEVGWKAALSYGFSKWGVALGASIVTGLALIGLYILLIIPGIIFSVYWTFMIYAVILRGKGVGEAMKYSKEMVKKRWWRTLGFQLSLGIILGLGMMIIALPVSILLFIPGLNILGTVITNYLDFLIGAITISVLTVLFLNWDKHRVAKTA